VASIEFPKKKETKEESERRLQIDPERKWEGLLSSNSGLRRIKIGGVTHVASKKQERK